MSIKHLAAGLLATAAILLTGCSGGQAAATGTPAGAPATASAAAPSAAAPMRAPAPLPHRNPNSIVTIDGQAYDCETVTGINDGNCSVEAQQVFDTHKQNIDPFVNSGQLGELSKPQYTIQDAAYVGIGSCAYQMRGQSIETFIAFLRHEPTFRNVSDADITLTASVAHKMLCPVSGNTTTA